MQILGIETSCDETAAAVVDDGWLIRSNVIASQIPVHERFGGIVPEIASRQHVLSISAVTRRALDCAGCDFADLDAIAVTYGPGLAGPLMVGVTFAKGVSLAAGIPLLAVNHVEAHVLSVWLTAQAPGSTFQVSGSTFDRQPSMSPASDESTGDHFTHSSVPELPMVSLVVSGGHTELILVTAPGVYRLLGRTLDDAAGEAFDKVGRLLGLPYPGGPGIESTAAGSAGSKAYVLPRAWLPGTYDFSFSGLKTAMMRAVNGQAGPADHPATSDVATLAAAFQESVADVLTRKLDDAVRDVGARSAAIVGGVAGNGFIRAMALERLAVPTHFPGPNLSSDNAAMIAGAGYWNPHRAGLDLEVRPSLAL